MLQNLYLLYDKTEKRIAMVHMSENREFSCSQFSEYLINRSLPPARFSVLCLCVSNMVTCDLLSYEDEQSTQLLSTITSELIDYRTKQAMNSKLLYDALMKEAIKNEPRHFDKSK